MLAETATGVSSPLLAERGLVAALTAELAGREPAIAVDAGARAAAGCRFPPAVESAVYFCCLEAVNNARKHAPGAAVSLRLSAAGGVLRFTVRDDGPGFLPSRAGSAGRGLRNVTARIAAVGGRLAVHSAPGQAPRWRARFRYRPICRCRSRRLARLQSRPRPRRLVRLQSRPRLRPRRPATSRRCSVRSGRPSAWRTRSFPTIRGGLGWRHLPLGCLHRCPLASSVLPGRARRPWSGRCPPACRRLM